MTMIVLARLLRQAPPLVSRTISTSSASKAVQRGATFVVARFSEDLPQQVSYYHSTTRTEFPVRRRRRPSHRNQDDSVNAEETHYESPLRHSPVVDTDEFLRAADELLTRIEGALEPMKAQNETFILERSRGDLGEVITLDLGAKLGNYRIEISEEDHIFEYSSPISGKILYVLSAATGEWVGQEDGHNFEGLLVRDLIRYCRGMPKL
eukprot:CAMPEP_0117074400 /NCGR_PEP_ID=MMETSP0472-20121206/52417_1 /TAXON_ID=693140 ORGANISM="Tiarina fusus, Strain LIS" /NCGR_SAMPLE_ID=MMETSP0472 /ASSEMBLY_ACC=CAM_ASM_000603 /LENGTH=207 /DNA_ID=CAMNT_0004799405 /DNA_START=83 /DNA_END=706 /DNA_ORIENTATION=-